tara:strand:- start:43024 stop:43698 length:675 start_codon:yes stop_codon:yes gene_type:complete
MNKPLNIFYHLLCINDGIERFTKTYDKIKKYKLLESTEKIFVNCVGENQLKFSESISHLPKVEIILGKNDKNESETINLMREFAINNDGFSLYLHAKGVWRSKTHLNRRNKVCGECLDSYIDFMEFFVIEKFYHCVEMLKTYKTCGCNLMRSKAGHSYYSGNFWWTRNDYIASLPECEDNRKAPEHFINAVGDSHKNLHTSLFGYPTNLKKVLPRDSYESKVDY